MKQSGNIDQKVKLFFPIFCGNPCQEKNTKKKQIRKKSDSRSTMED